MIPKALANAVVVLVSLVWAGNFFASVFAHDYQPDSAINFVFMTIVGGALALRRGPSDGTGGYSPNMAQRVVDAFRTPDPPAEPGKLPEDPK